MFVHLVHFKIEEKQSQIPTMSVYMFHALKPCRWDEITTELTRSQEEVAEHDNYPLDGMTYLYAVLA